MGCSQGVTTGVTLTTISVNLSGHCNNQVFPCESTGQSRSFWNMSSCLNCWNWSLLERRFCHVLPDHCRASYFLGLAGNHLKPTDLVTLYQLICQGIGGCFWSTWKLIPAMEPHCQETPWFAHQDGPSTPFCHALNQVVVVVINLFHWTQSQWAKTATKTFRIITISEAVRGYRNLADWNVTKSHVLAQTEQMEKKENKLV